MRWQVSVPVAVMSALSVGVPLAAQSVPAVSPFVVIPVMAREDGRASVGPTIAAAAEQGGKKKEQDEGVRIVFEDRPSIRAGKWLRIDLLLKAQGFYRSSEQDLTDYGGTYGLDRARVGVKGELFKRVDFEVERELRGTSNEAASSISPWHDVYVNFRAVPAIQVQAGRFKIPFSLDELTGLFDLDFTFRSRVAHQLAPGRDTGVMAHGVLLKKRLHYQLGAFRADGDNPPIPEPPYPAPGQTSPRSPSYAGRVVWKAVRDLSIGGGVVTTNVPEGRNNLRDRSVLGYHTFETLYVKGQRLRVGADVDWTPGSFSVRGEYIRSREARVAQGAGDEHGLDSTLPDYVGHGWYVAGTWAATGEKKAGGIVPKKPLLQGGFGAIELVGRLEALAFASADTSEPPSRSRRAANPGGNAERVVTFGVNWYLNKWIKAAVNRIGEQIEDPQYSPVPGKNRFWSTVFRLQFAM